MIISKNLKRTSFMAAFALIIACSYQLHAMDAEGVDKEFFEKHLNRPDALF